MARRRQPEANRDEPRDILELVAKMLVAGSYRVPVAGKGSKPGLQSTEIAAAVAMIPDKLDKAVVLAVARRADLKEIARLVDLALPTVRRAARRALPWRPLDGRVPADRWRLRMVVFDAAFELVWPEKRQPWRVLAKQAKMRESVYRDLHKVATSTLQSCMNEGRIHLKHTLTHRA